MSVISSISLYTNWRDIGFQDVMDFYENQGGNINFDGHLHLMGNVNGVSDYFEVDVKKENSFFLLKKLYYFDKIFAFTMNINFAGVMENMTVFKYDNNLCVVLNGASKKIDGYYTDFTWYQKRVVKPLVDKFNTFDRIVYEDIIT